MADGSLSSSRVWPGVFRDGTCLVVPRGGDISGVCYCCGKSISLGAGGTTTVHVRMARQHTGMSYSFRRGTPFWLDMIILVVGTVYVVFYHIFDWRASRKRKLTFSLCDGHWSRRMLLKAGYWLAILGGLGLVVLAIALPSHKHTTLATWAGVVGLLLLFSSTFIPLFIPGPRLDKENGQSLWLRDAAKSVVERQAELPGK